MKKLKHKKRCGVREKEPIWFMAPCPYCGDPNVVITGNHVAEGYERGVIVQERTCETCGKKRYVRLIYQLTGVEPIREEDLARG